MQEQDKVKFLTRTIVDIEDPAEAFRIFEKGEVHKIIFDMTRS